ncbi:hypothetical protein ABZS76_32835 [Streptomyces sp. NPDC005562]|uniref:hypothetical protein n=1 Tax=Streptomyces sp. NPDC005562 TaxID=3154890 RepID=UPI0033B47034
MQSAVTPPWRQVFPHPDLDYGFRLDPAGRARFIEQGYAVDVVMRSLDEVEEDEANVDITASVTLHGVKVAEVEAPAPWREPHVMRDVLGSLLVDVVDEARSTVGELARIVADNDAKKAARHG